MTIKRFLSRLLCGVFFLTLSPSVHSMGDVLPPLAPIGDGPAVNLPETLHVASIPVDSGMIPQEVPQDLASLDPSSLSPIETLALPSNYEASENIKIWAPDSKTLELDQFPSSQISSESSVGFVKFNRLSTHPGETFLIKYLNRDGTLRENPLDSTLIRVMGGEASHFAGDFISTGNVVISNPAGVTFEHASNATVRGLLATTANITNEDFLSGSRTGRYQFTKGTQEPVINHGQITVLTGGFAALIGNNVRDDGVILGNLSRVIVAGAESYVLSFDGDSLVGFEIAATRENKEGQSLKNPKVEHAGSILNKGGLVLVTTKDAQKFVFEDSVNIKSIPQAASVEEKDGVITLKGKISVDGPQGGSIWVESSKDMVLDHATLTANGTEQKGGNVVVLGPELRSFGSTLRADGKLGGGRVLFGGDYQGKNPNINNSRNSFLDNETVLSVNALENGNGGQFVIWANNLTQNWSTTESKGGANGGNGGLENEISGKDDLFHRGKINTLSPKGKHGRTLLDPTNIIVEAAGMAGLPQTYIVPPGGNSHISPTTLLNAHSDIILEATNDITFTTTVSLNYPYSLTVRAGRNIDLSQMNPGDYISINNNVPVAPLQPYGDITFVANDSESRGYVGREDTSSGGIINPDTHPLYAEKGNISLLVGPTDAQGEAGPITQGPMTAGDIEVSTPANLHLQGDITSSGDVTLKGGTLMKVEGGSWTFNASGSVTLKNPLTAVNAQSLGLSINANSVTMDAVGGDASLNPDYFTVTASRINIGGPTSETVISSSGNINFTGPIYLTGPGDTRFTSDSGNIVLGSITGNGQNLTISAPDTATITLGIISNRGNFLVTGSNRTYLNGSITALSQTYNCNNVSILADIILKSISGDLTFNASVLGNTLGGGLPALTLDSAGKILPQNAPTFGTLFYPLKSLTILNASNLIGNPGGGNAVSIYLGTALGINDVLFLGSKHGGYFSGTLNNQSTSSTYASLISGASGSFYVNDMVNPLPYPPPPSSPSTAPVIQQQAPANDQAVNSIETPSIIDATLTNSDREEDSNLIQIKSEKESESESESSSELPENSDD